MTHATTTLNANELSTLRECYNSAEGNGFDFGFTDEVNPAGLNRHQIAGYLSALNAKGLIACYESDVNDTTELMFEISEEAREIVEAAIEADAPSDAELAAALAEEADLTAEEQAEVEEALSAHSAAHARREAKERFNAIFKARQTPGVNPLTHAEWMALTDEISAAGLTYFSNRYGRTEVTEPTVTFPETTLRAGVSPDAFEVSQPVEVHAMGTWYAGTITKIARKTVTVTYTSGGPDGVTREKKVNTRKLERVRASRAKRAQEGWVIKVRPTAPAPAEEPAEAPAEAPAEVTAEVTVAAPAEAPAPCSIEARAAQHPGAVITEAEEAAFEEITHAAITATEAEEAADAYFAALEGPAEVTAGATEPAEAPARAPAHAWINDALRALDTRHTRRANALRDLATENLTEAARLIDHADDVKAIEHIMFALAQIREIPAGF
jgi:DNA-binding PadR family transcriptional regulator